MTLTKFWVRSRLFLLAYNYALELELSSIRAIFISPPFIIFPLLGNAIDISYKNGTPKVLDPSLIAGHLWHTNFLVYHKSRIMARKLDISSLLSAPSQSSKS